MNIENNYNMLGSLSSSKVIEKLQQVDWNIWTLRQDSFSVHKKTHSVPLYWGPKVGSDIIVHKENCSLFEEELNIIKNLFNYFYSDEFFYTTAVFAQLKNQESITHHYDSAERFSITHRIHWCIDGDYSKLNFLIDGERLNIRKNDIFEMNNKKHHSVDYNGDEPRIHMICDFISKKNYNEFWK